MDQYVSTYRRDFPDPQATTSDDKKDGSKGKAAAPTTGRPCVCGMDPKDAQVPRTYGVIGESHDWSRVGPMGPLLDPKMYPAKTGPGAETEQMKFGQPDVYLKKLKEKYPYLYGVLESGAPEDTSLTVDKDRMKTTYMKDFGEIGESREKSSAETGKEACAPPKRTKRDCRPHTRPPLRKSLATSLDKEGKDGGSSRKGEDMNGPEVRIPPWRSEYQDGIGKTGHSIIKYKIHFPEDSPARLRT